MLLSAAVANACVHFNRPIDLFCSYRLFMLFSIRPPLHFIYCLHNRYKISIYWNTIIFHQLEIVHRKKPTILLVCIYYFEKTYSRFLLFLLLPPLHVLQCNEIMQTKMSSMAMMCNDVQYIVHTVFVSNINSAVHILEY